MSPAALRKSLGLTVIETLIAATLFLTAAVVLVGLYPMSARASRQAQGHLMATYLAERELELVRAMEYSAIENREEEYVLTVENNGARNDIEFETEITVREIRAGLKSIVVKVNYLGPDFFNRELRMETYAAQISP